jgi:hypothetical protein
VDHLERVDGSRILFVDSLPAPESGVYFMVKGGRRAGALVVNPPAAESRLERWSASALASRIGDGRSLSGSPDALPKAAFRVASTRTLLAPLLIATLVILLVESLLVSARRRASF